MLNYKGMGGVNPPLLKNKKNTNLLNYKTMGFGADLGMTAAQSGLNIIGSVIGNAMAAKREAQARKENFEYGERAAENADARQRAQFKDLYSAGAQLSQLKEAGLSPEMMYSGGGMSLGGSATGAMGNSGAVSPTTFGIEPVQLAQIRNINADTELKEANKQNIKQDTILKQVEEITRGFKNAKLSAYSNLADKYITFNNESITPIEAMEHFKSFNDWEKKMRDLNAVIFDGYTYEEAKRVWNAQQYYKTQIAELGTAETDAKFKLSIIQALDNEDFAKLNGKAAADYLRQASQSAELTEKQKGAWNRVLEKIGEWGETYQDIAVILMSIIDRGLTQYHLPEINTGGKTIIVNKEQ